MKLSTVNTYCSPHITVPKTAPEKGKDADEKHIHQQRLNLAVTEMRLEARVSDLSTQTHTHRHIHTSQCDLSVHTHPPPVSPQHAHTHPSVISAHRHIHTDMAV